MAWDVFNKLASRGNWSKEDAFYGILFAAAMADGEVTASESEEVIALAHRTATLKGVSMADLQSMHSRVDGAFRKDFAAALGEAAASVPKEAAPAVFAHATDIIFADGKVVTQEVEFLRNLASKLGLPEADTNKIIEVMKTKNEF
ncbi:MAG: tellurite resistance TerB family protein [Hyphomonadaceae bacterium]